MGYVYIFENEWMPKLVKIGMTGNIEDRLRDSGRDTFVPCVFNCYYAIESDKYQELEDFIHSTYDMFRVNDSREFFELSPETAKTMLSGLVKLGIAVEVSDAETEKMTANVSKELTASGEQIIFRRRPRSTFKMLGIPVESELQLKSDSSVVCKTVDEINLVEYEGEERTISNLSDKLMGYSTNGFEFFIYKGKVLGDIRREIESH